MTSNQRKQIEEIFKEFLKSRYKSVRNLNLQDLQINPLFLSQLTQHLLWGSVRNVVSFLVNETFQRGTVTSAGFQMEKIAKVFGRRTAIRGIDLEIEKSRPGGGMNIYYVQVKAGPNTIHKDTQVRIEENFNYALRRNPGAIPIVGIAYGNTGQANSFTRKLMQRFQVLFGKNFWSFISDDPNCLDEIYQISARVAATFVPSFRGRPVGKTVQQLLDEKIAELTQQWEATYGGLDASMWTKLL